MKSLFSILLVLIFSLQILSAQHIPSGMKYQAVARNAAGAILPNKSITLRIELKNADKSYYSEEHAVQTNQIGLFDLVVGGGDPKHGNFNEIPWSTDDIWMAVSIKDNAKDEDFFAISESKLLAVPYAYHALTASQLVGNSSEPAGNAARDGSGEFPIYWTLTGNFGTDPERNKLGTLDYQDLILITNDVERLRISSDGIVNIQKNLEVQSDVIIGENLTVHQHVALNTEGGETINNGPFTVANNSSAVLTGPLQVNEETQLRSSLTVAGETQFKRDVTIDENLYVGKNLGVGGATHLEDTLTVDGWANFESPVFVNNGSNTILSGDLVVQKSASIRDNLIIGGHETISGNVYAGGIMQVDSALFVNDQTTIRHTWDSNVYQDESKILHHGLILEGANQGMAIKLDVSAPLPDDNYITFFNRDGEAQGRIEGSSTLVNINRQIIANLISVPGTDTIPFGQILNNLNINRDFNRPPPSDVPASFLQYLTSGYATEALHIAIDITAVIARLIINSIGCLAGATVLGDCDDILWGLSDLTLVLIQSTVFVVSNELGTGVAFESGGADYAEWLPKADVKERLTYGEVVGVKGGEISKTFVEAEKFMVVSSAPAVIGNAPAPDKLDQYSKIAFMGQIPVKVMGETAKGDYILPSGNGDGMAMSVYPDDMKAMDYKRVIGIAWSESEKDKTFTYINTAVGINSNDLANTVDQMQQTLNEMQLVLQRLVPEYTPTYYQTSGTKKALSDTDPGYSYTASLSEEVRNQLKLNNTSDVREAFMATKNYLKASDVDLSQIPYLEQILDNPSVETLTEAQKHYDSVIKKLQTISRQMAKKG